jgi:LemA protein
MTAWILIFILAAIAFYAIFVFNRLVSLRQLANEGWSGIDVQLKRRSDLVPNLVDSVKGYAGHERNVLEEVTAQRERARNAPANDVGQRAQAEAALGTGLAKLMMLAEAYPELKASANFLSLQRQLSDLENEIQMSRRYYNGTVRNLNTLIQSVPSNFIAGIAGFRPATYFELSEPGDRAVPQISLGA